MAATAERIEQVVVEEEMQSSFIDYAMSVIVSRALPEVSGVAASSIAREVSRANAFKPAWKQ